jgi:hypothetical protein
MKTVDQTMPSYPGSLSRSILASVTLASALLVIKGFLEMLSLHLVLPKQEKLLYTSI